MPPEVVPGIALLLAMLGYAPLHYYLPPFPSSPIFRGRRGVILLRWTQFSLNVPCGILIIWGLYRSAGIWTVVALILAPVLFLATHAMLPDLLRETVVMSFITAVILHCIVAVILLPSKLSLVALVLALVLPALFLWKIAGGAEEGA